MITNAAFRQMALALPDAEEQPHFNLASFRVKKKIFATLWEADRKAMLRLTPVQQSVYCGYNNAVFYPVPGGWGSKGATFVNLTAVKKTVLAEALRAAYEGVVMKKK
jgi:YjbR